MKSTRIQLTMTESERQMLQTRAAMTGQQLGPYIKSELLRPTTPGRLSAEGYREAVEACARTVSLPRTHIEALVALVVQSLHDSAQKNA
jgi:hypothetical protein